jgi:hypothetical protein
MSILNSIRRHGPGIGIGLAASFTLYVMKELHDIGKKEQNKKICDLYRKTLEKAGCIGVGSDSVKDTRRCDKLVAFLLEEQKNKPASDL